MNNHALLSLVGNEVSAPLKGKKCAIMALSAPHWVKRATEKSAGLNSQTPFSLQNAIRIAAHNALSGTGPLRHSNWASEEVLRESVLLMEYWEDEKEALREKILHIRPDLLFIGAMTPSFPGAVETAKLAKELLGDDVFVVLGGKHVNETFFDDGERDLVQLSGYENKHGHIRHTKGSPLRLMEEEKIPPVFDLVCSGRCEEMIAAVAAEISDLLAHGGKPQHIYQNLASLTNTARGDWRMGWLQNGTKKQYQSNKAPLDNNALPIPAKLFGITGKFDVFGTELTAHAFSDTAAGCVFDCFFCSERSTINGRADNPTSAADRLFRQLKVIKETAMQENGTDSVSVFVEDSTLLGTGKKPDQLQRLASLMKEANFSITFGGQFTVDQLQNPAIQEALLELRTVGLSYVFAGMETADEEIAQDMSKNVDKTESWLEKNERAIAFLESANLQYGVAVLFGLGENQETRLGQLRQIKKWQRTYSLPSVVSINLATTHPLQQDDGSEEDFTEWGVAKDSPYLPHLQRFFSEASDRYALKRDLLPTLEELQEIEALYNDLQLAQQVRDIGTEQTLTKYRDRFSNDFYVDDDIYAAYLAKERGGIHFNSASIGEPFTEVSELSATIAEREARMSEEERLHVFSNARKEAARIAGLPEGEAHSVIFGRNTTEATAFAFWLAGLETGDGAVLTDAENASIPRIFELHLDHGNPLRRDEWSTWPTHYSARGPAYPTFIANKTAVEIKTMHVIDVPDEEIEKSLRDTIDANTRIFVCSHVLRDSGRKMPIRTICEAARRIKAECNPDDPELFVLIDGAQALGNLPNVDVRSLGCDAYSAAPHKTMKSDVAGVLYINLQSPIVQKNLPRLNGLDASHQQVILEGMFDEQLGIRPNVDDHLSPADIAGFTKAVEILQREHGLHGNDFSTIANHRKEIKARCIEEFRSLGNDLGINIVIPEQNHSTDFILPIQFPDQNTRAIVKALWGRGIFVSYMEGESDSAAGKIMRVSFQMDTTADDTTHFIDELRMILSAQQI